MRRAVGLLLLAPLAHAQPAPSVTAKPSRTEVGVGEAFTVELTASGPAGTTWTFPSAAGDDKVELRTADPVPAPGSTPASPVAAFPPGTWRYDATAFAVEDVAVPPVSARYRLADGTEGEVSTEAVPLKIATLLPKDPDERKLADIREPVSVPIRRLYVVTAAALSIALAAWLWRKLERRREPASSAYPEIARAPDLEALEALDALLASGALARAEFRPFYIALSEIAKRYLERRLAAPVLEMTSTEMLAFLREQAHGQPFVTMLRDLSVAADQVKFARAEAQADEAARHAAAVRELIGAMEARLRAVAQPAAASAPRASVAGAAPGKA